jgi:hypothetical protein
MNHYTFLALSVTLLSTTIASGQSQKLQDFQAAVKVDRGCDTIPYDGLRRNCQDQGKNVHEWCDGNRGPVRCENSTDSESVAFSLSDLLERFLTARNCMSLILKMETSAESGLRVDHKSTPTY